MHFQLKSVKLDQDGLSKVLGFLEAEIMETIWARGQLTVRELRESLKQKKSYSFNTIMTVMNRLVEKKLLSKVSIDGAYVYSAVETRESFLKEVTRSVVSAIVADGSLFQMAGFAEAIKGCNDEDLRALKQIIDQA